MMRAKAYVEQVEKINNMIQNKKIEAEQWQAIAMGSGSSMNQERVQTSTKQSKMADAVNMYVDIQKEIEEELSRLIQIKREVISTIEMLPSDEYDVLHKAYIQLMDFKEIATEKRKAYTWVTTIHGRALKNLQNLLDKKKI